MSEICIFADLVVGPEHRETFERRFRALVERNRAEEGNVHFEVHEVTGAPGHYCVYERWRDRAAFDEHLALDRVQAFLAWMEADGIGSTTRLLTTERWV